MWLTALHTNHAEASATGGGKQPPASNLQRLDSPPCWLNWNQCLPNGFDGSLKKGNFQPLKVEIPVTTVRAGKVCKAEWSPKKYFHSRRFQQKQKLCWECWDRGEDLKRYFHLVYLIFGAKHKSLVSSREDMFNNVVFTGICLRKTQLC